jgi:hypothetical protein
METSHWHRKTSLLLLGITVEHMLGAESKGHKSNGRLVGPNSKRAKRRVDSFPTQGLPGVRGKNGGFRLDGRQLFVSGD